MTKSLECDNIGPNILDLKNARLDQSVLQSCIHCGLCLPACPTYLATGREMESPRGRIYLISDWFENGGTGLSARAQAHIDSCLGCLGCQTACPSGVAYEKILDGVRPLLAAKRSFVTRFFSRLVFRRILPDYKLLNGFAQILGMLQRTGFDKAFAALAAKMPGGLSSFQYWFRFAPRLKERKLLPQISRRSGPEVAQVRLFSGCVMDVFYNRVNLAAISLLNDQGKTVYCHKQTCCGALAYHAGEVEIARELACRNIEFFGEKIANKTADLQPVVVTSAGCGAMLKNYGHLLSELSDWKERAEAFSKRVVDLSQELAANDFIEPYLKDESDSNAASSPTPDKVVYHAACHLAHAQGVREEPQKLLSQMALECGYELVPLPEAEHCCGSAGIYNLFHPKLSLAVLERKLKFIEESGAKTVVTCNPGCQLQLNYGIASKGLNVKVMHLAEALLQERR